MFTPQPLEKTAMSESADKTAGQVNEATHAKANKKPQKIRIMIADDHPVFVEGLRRILELEEDLEVIGEAYDGPSTISKVQELKPDVLLLDLRMPGMDGLEVLEHLQQLKVNTKILVLTASENRQEFVEAMRLGCSGIVLKHTQTPLLLKSIRKVYEGEIWLDSTTTAAVIREFASASPSPTFPAPQRTRARSPLSNREREIVALVAQGYRNKEIAEKLFISEQTVKNHLHNIFDKLGVSDRLELALYAIHKGLHQSPGER